MQAFWVLDLRGPMLHEVEKEVARIRMDDHFMSLQQFDCCLHSLYVLNGCKMHAVKTQPEFHLHVCPFGPRVRPSWQRQAQDGPPVNRESRRAISIDILLQGAMKDGHLTTSLQPHNLIGKIVKRCTRSVGRPSTLLYRRAW